MAVSLNRQNCLQETNYELQDLIELTGILGVLPNYDPYSPTNYGTFDAIYKSGIVNITILNNDVLSKFVRNIDLIDKEISNDYMIKDTHSTINRIGYSILSNQVGFAVTKGFKIMIIDAHHDPNNKFWDGYWLWGKYGYIMDLPYRDKFLNKLRPHFNNLNIKDQDIMLHEFLKIPAAFDLWKDHEGFQWNGTFDLANGSISRDVLKNA